MADNDRPPALMTTAEAARELATSTTTIRRMYHRGELPAVRVGELLKFRRVDIDAYIDAHLDHRPRHEPAPQVRRRRYDIEELERRYPHLAG